jgi:mediator of RNA polymerase II transcription subunit 5
MILTVRDWAVFLERSLETRVRPDKFERLAHRLHARSPIPSKILAELLIRPREPGSGLLDPLIPLYFERVFTQGRVSSADALRSAFKWSRDRPLKREGDPAPLKGRRAQWRNPPLLDEIIFQRLARAFANGEAPKNSKETKEVLRICAEWMQLMVSNHNNDSMLQAMSGAVQPVQIPSLLVREALGLLLLALMENDKVAAFISSPEFLKGISVISRLA